MTKEELEWWEERKEGDMPEYLKKVSEAFYDSVRVGEIITLSKFIWWGFSINELKYFTPSTKEEYESQIKKDGKEHTEKN